MTSVSGANRGIVSTGPIGRNTTSTSPRQRPRKTVMIGMLCMQRETPHLLCMYLSMYLSIYVSIYLSFTTKAVYLLND